LGTPNSSPPPPPPPKKSHFHPTPLPTKGKEIDACSLVVDGEGFIFLIVLVINFGLGSWQGNEFVGDIVNMVAGEEHIEGMMAPARLSR
jgi:hypothetical protein